MTPERVSPEEVLNQWVDDLTGECDRIEEQSWVEDDPQDCLAAKEERPCPYCGLRKAIADRVRAAEQAAEARGAARAFAEAWDRFCDIALEGGTVGDFEGWLRDRAGGG